MSDSTQTANKKKNIWSQLFPLTLVISYLLGGVIAIAFVNEDFSAMSLMSHYMAGFFFVFSFFKFLNIQGFVNAFSLYDVIAKNWKPYGYFYAAFELMAGFGYLLVPESLILNLAILLILGISSYGVTQAVLRKNKIRCACLGTLFNLPMTKVTIVENVTMMVMAAITIFIRY